MKLVKIIITLVYLSLVSYAYSQDVGVDLTVHDLTCTGSVTNCGQGIGTPDPLYLNELIGKGINPFISGFSDDFAIDPCAYGAKCDAIQAYGDWTASNATITNFAKMASGDPPFGSTDCNVSHGAGCTGTYDKTIILRYAKTDANWTSGMACPHGTHRQPLTSNAGKFIYIASNPSTITTELTAAVVLPAATLNVTDTTGFASAGSLTLNSASPQTLAYTGKSGTTFTGVTGGSALFIPNHTSISQSAVASTSNPTFNQTKGSTTTDNACTWRNLGVTGIDLATTINHYYSPTSVGVTVAPTVTQTTHIIETCTDDTVPIQAAVDAAGGGPVGAYAGGLVRFPTNKGFCTSSTINVNSNQRIEMGGWGNEYNTDTPAIHWWAGSDETQSMWQFRYNFGSGIRDGHFIGLLGAPPLFAVEYKDVNGDQTTQINEFMVADNLYIGSILTDQGAGPDAQFHGCVGFTPLTSTTGNNNSPGRVSNIQCSSWIDYAFDLPGQQTIGVSFDTLQAYGFGRIAGATVYPGFELGGIRNGGNANTFKNIAILNTNAVYTALNTSNALIDGYQLERDQHLFVPDLAGVTSMTAKLLLSHGYYQTSALMNADDTPIKVNVTSKNITNVAIDFDHADFSQHSTNPDTGPFKLQMKETGANGAPFFLSMAGTVSGVGPENLDVDLNADQTTQSGVTNVCLQSLANANGGPQSPIGGIGKCNQLSFNTHPVYQPDWSDLGPVTSFGGPVRIAKAGQAPAKSICTGDGTAGAKNYTYQFTQVVPEQSKSAALAAGATTLTVPANEGHFDASYIGKSVFLFGGDQPFRSIISVINSASSVTTAGSLPGATSVTAGMLYYGGESLASNYEICSNPSSTTGLGSSTAVVSVSHPLSVTWIPEFNSPYVAIYRDDGSAHAANLTADTPLPQATIAVDSTTGFVAGVNVLIIGSNVVTCTGKTATTFTGCTGGSSAGIPNGTRIVDQSTHLFLTMSQVATPSFTDTGAITPLGAIPTLDTTGTLRVEGITAALGGLLNGSVAFAALPTASVGQAYWCTDCKNSVDNAATIGAACANAGAGALAIRGGTGPIWKCY